jgi:hypothetical protein
MLPWKIGIGRKQGVQMTLFSAIKNAYEKREAVFVVQKLLKHQTAIGTFSGDPGQVARALVEKTWDAKAGIFSGKPGQRPHRLTIAAAACMAGVESLGSEHADYPALAISLGTILQEVELNRFLYAMSSMDDRLLSDARDYFAAISSTAFDEGNKAAHELERVIRSVGAS